MTAGGEIGLDELSRRVAEELAMLAGGAGRVAARARELLAEGHLRLASHLAETAALGATIVHCGWKRGSVEEYLEELEALAVLHAGMGSI